MLRKITKYFTLKPPLALKGEINYTATDRFTAVHFSIGLLYGLLGLRFGVVLFLSIAWELIENPLKANFPRIFPRGTADTFQNAFFDCIAVILGWTTIIAVTKLFP